MKREIWNIIAKHLTDETLNKEELTYLKEEQTNEEMKQLIEESTSTLNKVDQFFELNKINTDTAWRKINVQLDKPRKVISISKKTLRFAAIIVLLIATSVATWKLIPNNSLNNFQTAQTDISKPQITLPDGTKVTLNYGSKLEYPIKFKGDKRVVTLKGEAFFDVTPNKEMPFIIKTKSASVKVLGTSFNVYAYDKTPTLEVTVERGTVELIDNLAANTTSNKVVLLPGDKGTLNKTTHKLIKMTPKISNSLAWITHNIEFESTELDEVITTLEHIYNITIELDDQVDSKQIITASFSKQEPDHIIDVVALTLSLDIKNKGSNAYFIKNK